MLSVLRNLCHRPAIRFGMARDGCSRFRDPRFVSFLADNNRNLMDTDFHEALLRGRRFMRQLLVALLVVGVAWVLVESARAISVF